MKKWPGKAIHARSAPKKETWLKELRGPLLKAVTPACRKFEKAAGSIPKCYLEPYQEPWAVRIYELIEGSINKVFNLKNEPDCDAMTLGILTAQAANCAEMNLALQLKGKKLKPRISLGMKTLISLVTPVQEALGLMSPKIMRLMDRQPWEARVAFHNGYSRALEKKDVSGGESCVFRKHANATVFAPPLCRSLDAPSKKRQPPAWASVFPRFSNRRS